MTDKQITDVLERVKKWSKGRQETAAQILLEIEAQDSSQYQLTNEQTAEVKRRLSDPDPIYLSFEEIEKYFADRKA